MSEEKKYALTTIKDIFDTVPIERIPACMEELGALIVQAKGMDATMCAAAEAITGIRPDKAFDWPEPVTWIDDDKRVVVANFHAVEIDTPIISIKTTFDRKEKNL